MMMRKWKIEIEKMKNENDAKNDRNPGTYGYTHLRVLCKSFLMNTNMAGFERFKKKFCILVPLMNVALALKELK